MACYGSQCSTAADPPVFTNYPTNTGSLLGDVASAKVFRPGGARFEGGPGHASVPASGTPGADCLVIWTAPAQWNEVASTGETFVWFQLPPDLRPFQGSPFSQYGIGGSNLLTPEEAARATLQGATIPMQRAGKYDDGGVCQPVPGDVWRMPCIPPVRLQPVDACLQWIPRTVLGAPNAVAWGPYAADVANSLIGQAGHVVSSPSARGVVNTPTCFWVEGMGIPNSVDRLLYLAGPPDAFGRQIFYTFIIHAAFNGIRWVFDDPANNGEAAPAPACGDSTAHPHLTAHQYSTISEGRHPDNRYSVTAYESYVITVDEYWFDQRGLNHVQPVPPIPLQEIHTDPYPQYVVQVEGVPQA